MSLVANSSGPLNKRTGATRWSLRENWKAMRGNALTEIQARKILADLYEIRNGERLPGSTAKTFFTSWASNKVLETSDSTGVHYRQVVRTFIESLGKRSEADLSMLTPRDAFDAHAARCD